MYVRASGMSGNGVHYYLVFCRTGLADLNDGMAGMALRSEFDLDSVKSSRTIYLGLTARFRRKRWAD